MQYMYSVWNTHIYIYTVNMSRFNLTYFIFYLYYILSAGGNYFLYIYIIFYLHTNYWHIFYV